MWPSSYAEELVGSVQRLLDAALAGLPLWA
jgi:hypothetical protein